MTSHMRLNYCCQATHKPRTMQGELSEFKISEEQRAFSAIIEFNCFNEPLDF